MTSLRNNDDSTSTHANLAATASRSSCSSSSFNNLAEFEFNRNCIPVRRRCTVSPIPPPSTSHSAYQAKPRYSQRRSAGNNRLLSHQKHDCRSSSPQFQVQFHIPECNGTKLIPTSTFYNLENHILFDGNPDFQRTMCDISGFLRRGWVYKRSIIRPPWRLSYSSYQLYDNTIIRTSP
jgi:hypothetical protein